MAFLARLLLFAFLLCSPCLSAELTGTYVARDSVSAMLVQLVASRAGPVSGRLELTTVTDTGELVIRSATLEGSAAGEQAVLVLSMEQPQHDHFSLSAARTANGLRLEGGGLDVVLVPAPLEVYRKGVDELAKTANLNKALSEQKSAVVELDALNLELGKFATDVAERHTKLAPTKQAYRTSADQAERAFVGASERLHSAGGAPLMSQMATSLSQTELQMAASYRRVQEARRWFEEKSAELTAKSQEAAAHCKALTTLLTSEQQAVWKMSCEVLGRNREALRSDILTMTAGFDEISEVWTQEHSRLVGLLQRAEALE